MNNKFNIRLANLEDLNILVNFRVAILHELNLLKEGDETTLMIPKFRDFIQNKLKSGELLCWLIEFEKKIVGVGKVLIYEVPPQSLNYDGKECYIFGIYIIPEMRNKGFATLLTKHIIQEIKNLGYKYIFLKASKDGMSIYQKLGFGAPGQCSCQFMELKL